MKLTYKNDACLTNIQYGQLELTFFLSDYAEATFFKLIQQIFINVPQKFSIYLYI